MKKSQKRQKRLVLVAMILMIGLVAGMGAMTYSRYISTTTLPSQEATAAKWGYVITTNVQSLFADTYKKDGSNAIAKVDGSGNVVVKGDSNAIVVAPGTTGSMIITIQGQAEVMAKLTFKLENLVDIEYDGYHPVKWTLKKGEDPVAGCNGVSLSELQTGINAFNASVSNAAIAPNTSVAGTYTLSWEWAFETAGTPEQIAEINAKDSLIGYSAAGVEWATIANVKCATGATYATFTGDSGTKYDNISFNISFDLSITLEQIQA